MKKMAIEKVIEHQNQSFLLDALYCHEEKWADVEDYAEECLDEELGSQNNVTNYYNNKSKASPFSLLLLEQDLFWEDEELISLFTKEKETHCDSSNIENDSSLTEARRAAVEWILKVNAHFGFSALAAILAVNYLDRFLSSLHYQQDKPWMIQLAAVTCLSLAAKVEETQVPLLLDLQVEDSKYVFEAKTIQRMELLVLSTLKWRMNPVTPLSFLDHIIRRLGLKKHQHWEFLSCCESLLLSIVDDCRFLRYPPSILAAATMLHVIHQVEPCNAVDYQMQLLDVLKISKEKVNCCYQLIIKLSSEGTTTSHAQDKNAHKRSYDNQVPSGWNDSSETLFKKRRVEVEQKTQLPSALSCRLFVDAVGSPR